MSTRNKIAVGVGIYFVLTAMYLLVSPVMFPESVPAVEDGIKPLIISYMVIGLTLAACIYKGKSEKYKRIRKKNRAIKIGIAIMMIGVITTYTDVEAMCVAVCVGLVFVWYGVSGRAIKKDEYMETDDTKIIDMQKVDKEAAENKNTMIDAITCKHSYGLPMEIGKECKVFKDDINKVFEIIDTDNTYTLAYDKITEISIADKIDSQYVLSIDMEIVGKDKNKEYSLTFTYNDKDGYSKHLVMDIENTYLTTCYQWVNEFRKNNDKIIEL